MCWHYINDRVVTIYNGWIAVRTGQAVKFRKVVRFGPPIVWVDVPETQIVGGLLRGVVMYSYLCPLLPALFAFGFDRWEEGVEGRCWMTNCAGSDVCSWDERESQGPGSRC